MGPIHHSTITIATIESSESNSCTKRQAHADANPLATTKMLKLMFAYIVS